MENPVVKKRNPWVWVAAGCGVVALGVLALAAVLIIFTVVPAVKARIATQVPLLNQGIPPLIGPTPVPNGGAGGGTSVGDLPFKFSAVNDPTVMANQSLMGQMSNSLSLNNDSDFMAPKTYKGTAVLDSTSPFTLGNGWCAKDDATLKQNWSKLQYQLSINGTNIDLSKYPTVFFTDNQGLSCAATGITITPDSNIQGNYNVVLTQKYQSSINDGITSSPYPAGDVTFDFTIQFQASPTPGGQPVPGTTL